MSSSEGDRARLREGAERRLHPWSWVFVLLAQLKEFAIPLLALLFFGRGGDWQEAAAAVAAVVLSLVAVLRYYTYRFRIDAGELVIRDGVLQRQVRHLPLGRITNIALRQNPLHRLFGVAEVRLESATGGNQAEAQMRVLALRDAEALEALIRAARRSEAAPTPAAAGVADAHEDAAEAAAPLLQVPLRDLFWLGLASNRGMVVVGAAFGVLWQLDPDGFGRHIPNLIEVVYGELRTLHVGLAYITTVVLLFTAASLALRLLGVIVVVARHYGYRLHDSGVRLSCEGGLLTRQRNHVPRRKIQRWIVDEPWLLARRGLRRLRVETAGGRSGSEEHGGELVPVAPRARAQALLQRWEPDADLDRLDWQPVHPRAWRRWAFAPSLIVAGIVLAQCLFFGVQALPLLLLLPIPAWLARREARFAGWARRGELLFWRDGALNRRWLVLALPRVQALRLSQSPFDRRAGMADLLADSAGAAPMSGATVLRALPEAVARQLLEQLVEGLEPPLLAPEARGQQDQHGEHLQAPEQHAEGAQPDRGGIDRGEGGADLAEARAEVGQGGDGGAEAGQDVEPGGVHRQHQQDEAQHPQRDEAADRQHHTL
jgi:putative membrane protein